MNANKAWGFALSVIFFAIGGIAIAAILQAPAAHPTIKVFGVLLVIATVAALTVALAKRGH